MTQDRREMILQEKPQDIPGVRIERYETPQEWAMARMTGLGGSDIAAVLGLSPFRGPMHVFLEKTGLADDSVETEAMYWGSELESIIANRFAMDAGERLIHPENCLYRSEKHPWMIGTPDRLIYGKKEGLEIKTAGYPYRSYWGESGTDEVPEYYLTQCAWYMALTGYDRWHVAVLIGGSDYRTYTIERDPALEAMLIEEAQRFWEECVVANNPPRLDGTEATKAYLRKRFPQDTGEMKLATVEIDQLAEELAILNVEIAEKERRREEIKALMQEYIADAPGVVGNGWKATWKRTKDSRVVNWESVARTLQAPEELIEQNTTIKPGIRRFLFAPEKMKEGI